MGRPVENVGLDLQRYLRLPSDKACQMVDFVDNSATAVEWNAAVEQQNEGTIGDVVE